MKTDVVLYTWYNIRDLWRDFVGFGSILQTKALKWELASLQRTNSKAMAAKVLLLGATGGIGSQALMQLLNRGVHVTAIVRTEARLPPAAMEYAHLSTVVCESGALGMGVDEFSKHVQGCDAVVSCLGHNMNFKVRISTNGS